MGIGRKLFIDNEGLDKYAGLVYMASENDRRNENISEFVREFADIIDCKSYILYQLKLASKLNSIQSISVLRDGTIRARTRDLFITNSETGTLRKFFVGKWKIECDFNFHLKFRSCNITELGYHSSCWGNRTVHPHINPNNAEGCLGNASAPLNMYIRNGDIKAFVMYAVGYLTSVNIYDAAGRFLGGCKEVKLDDNGNVMHDELGNYMFIENEFNREHTNAISNVFETRVDETHHEFITEYGKKCSLCKKPYNNKYISCKDNKYICEDCLKNMKICDCCGRVIKEDIKNVKVDGLLICKECVATYINKCDVCDALMIPKGLTKENLKEALIKSKTNYKFIKNHTAYYNIEGNTRRVLMCDSCKELANVNDVVKNNIIMFTKKNVNKNYVNILRDNIPYNKYKMHCTKCFEGNGSTKYVSNMFIESMYIINKNKRYDAYCMTSNRRTSHMGDCGTDEVLNRYTNMLPVYKNGKLFLYVYDYKYTGIDGANDMNVLPLSVFKDKNKWAIEGNTMKVLEYNSDENIINSIIDNQVKCYGCNKVLQENDITYKDKMGNIFCEQCADNTYLTCSVCGGLVPISQQVYGVCDACRIR